MSEIIALLHEIYNTDEYLKKEGTEISVLEKSIKDLEESLESQKALLAKRKPNYEKRLKESSEAKEERAKHNTIRVLFTQADDVSASGSAASAFVSPLKRHLRVSYSARSRQSLTIITLPKNVFSTNQSCQMQRRKRLMPWSRQRKSSRLLARKKRQRSRPRRMPRRQKRILLGHYTC